MATPYGITGGTTTTSSTDSNTIDSTVSGNIKPEAKAALDKAFASANTGDGTKKTFDLTTDTTGGSQTITSSSSTNTSVFFADSSGLTGLKLSGSGSQIVVGGSGDLLATGSNAPQTIIGGSGGSTLSAGQSGGAHLLVGGSGGSSLIGGTGADTLTGGLYSSSNDTLTAGTGAHQLLTLQFGNNAAYANADTANAGISDTLIGGQSGNSTLVGSSNVHDTTYFSVGYGSSSTTVVGGAGKDSVFVHAGSGSVSIDGGTGKDTVTLADVSRKDVHFHTAGGVTTVTFAGSTQTVELKGVEFVSFGHGHTIKI